MLRFSREIMKKPITSQVILEHKIPVNILSAHMNQLGGEILAEIDSAHAESVIRTFRRRGVLVDVRKLIEKDDENCIDCGGCVSICPMDAINFDVDGSVVLKDERCIGVTCGLCLDACPRRVIRLIG